jgi:hypothetical protein
MLVVSRFNNETFANNLDYRKKHGFVCIYGSPSKLKCRLSLPASSFSSLPASSVSKRQLPPLSSVAVFVIEMNLFENKIEGIGLIRNRVYDDRYYLIYPKHGNYNRYTYIGKYYLNRKQLVVHEPAQAFIQDLESVLFRGKGHLKRGNGFTCVTEKVLKRMHSPVSPARAFETVQQCFKDSFGDQLFLANPLVPAALVPAPAATTI